LHTNIDKIRTVVIEEVIEETPSVKTFVFNDMLSSNAKPGQFFNGLDSKGRRTSNEYNDLQ